MPLQNMSLWHKDYFELKALYKADARWAPTLPFFLLKML